MARRPPSRPDRGEQRTGGKSGALRAAIFGVNDGLVSNLSLIFGVAGAGVDNAVVILAGVAGLLAGAFSMAAGEYISVRVQREVFERLIHLEAHEIGSDPEAERAELAEIYVRKGLPRDLAGQARDRADEGPRDGARDPRARGARARPREGLGSPFAAAGRPSSCSRSARSSRWCRSCSLGHAGGRRVRDPVGHRAVRGRRGDVLPDRSAGLFSGARMLAVGAAAAAITYLVGKPLDVACSAGPDDLEPPRRSSTTTSCPRRETRPAGIDGPPRAARGSIGALSPR